MIASRTAKHTTTFPNGQNLHLNKFELTPTAIVANGRPSFDEWEAVGCFLQVIERAHQWWIGDWMNYGEQFYGEKSAQAVDATGLQPDTITQYAWVARQVPLERRDPELSFSHHREVADLPAGEQNAWLKQAREGTDGAKWSVDKLRREINTAKRPDQQEYWLLVRCIGKQDLATMTERLQREGRTVKVNG